MLWLAHLAERRLLEDLVNPPDLAEQRREDETEPVARQPDRHHAVLRLAVLNVLPLVVHAKRVQCRAEHAHA